MAAGRRAGSRRFWLLGGFRPGVCGSGTVRTLLLDRWDGWSGPGPRNVLKRHDARLNRVASYNDRSDYSDRAAPELRSYDGKKSVTKGKNKRRVQAVDSYRQRNRRGPPIPFLDRQENQEGFLRLDKFKQGNMDKVWWTWIQYLLMRSHPVVYPARNPISTTCSLALAALQVATAHVDARGIA